MPLFLRARLPFSGFKSRQFAFLDSGPLVDAELELVQPSMEWVDAVLASCHHLQSVRESPSFAQTTRQQLLSFLRDCPHGRQPVDTSAGIVPTYHFWMRCHDRPDLPMAGGISLRLGNSYDTVMYYGHIGYHVYPPARGRHYAERATRLLLSLAARHGIDPLWVTCNPDNFASRRSCERLGAQLVEIVPVPLEHPLYQRGEMEKCRYRVETAPKAQV
jgi:tagatose 1,6-diphosphate aldolase